MMCVPMIPSVELWAQMTPEQRKHALKRWMLIAQAVDLASDPMPAAGHARTIDGAEGK